MCNKCAVINWLVVTVTPKCVGGLCVPAVR